MRLESIEREHHYEVSYAVITFSHNGKISPWKKRVRYAGCDNSPTDIRKFVEYACAKKAHEAYRDGLYDKHGDNWREFERFTIDTKARWAKVLSWRILGPEPRGIWEAIIELRDALYEGHKRRGLD